MIQWHSTTSNLLLKYVVLLDYNINVLTRKIVAHSYARENTNKPSEFG